MAYTLRRLQSHEEYKACERLQAHAWGFTDGIDVIPLTNLITAQKWGGLVLGAFDDDDELHGFCYGFLGRDPSDDRLVHCSHMLAVEERARNAGLGAQLKWAQRDHVREEGIDVIAWTYDPLESVNACLNFAKLGGLSNDYEVNLYGETTSKLHAGTPTDRLTLKWMIESPRVAQRAEGRRGAIATSLAAGDIDAPWALQADGWGPGDPALGVDAHRVRCRIPVSVQQVKDHDRGAAVAWREATRAVFTGYFARGYFVRECVHVRAQESGGEAETVYLLEHGDLETDGTQE